jgi:hypothetical protein
MAATTGDDPAAGQGATCALSIEPRLLLATYVYDCYLTSCGRKGSEHVSISYNRLTGQWHYRLDDSWRGGPTSGRGGPEHGASPSTCEGQGGLDDSYVPLSLARHDPKPDLPRSADSGGSP